MALGPANWPTELPPPPSSTVPISQPPPPPSLNQTLETGSIASITSPLSGSPKTQIPSPQFPNTAPKENPPIPSPSLLQRASSRVLRANVCACAIIQAFGSSDLGNSSLFWGPRVCLTWLLRTPGGFGFGVDIQEQGPGEGGDGCFYFGAVVGFPASSVWRFGVIAHGV
jgi:hypothetical protein